MMSLSILLNCIYLVLQYNTWRHVKFRNMYMQQHCMLPFGRENHQLRPPNKIA
jgi:hypothetical protein